MAEKYSANDVKGHSKPDSLWIIVESGVYDLTNFQEEHPGRRNRFTRSRDRTADMQKGGKKILQRVGGKDATKQFWKVSQRNVAEFRLDSETDNGRSITTRASSRSTRASSRLVT